VNDAEGDEILRKIIHIASQACGSRGNMQTANMSATVDTASVFHAKYIFTQNCRSSVSLHGCKNNESSGFAFQYLVHYALLSR